MRFGNPFSRGTFPSLSRDPFFLEHLQKPTKNGRLLERTMVEKNGESAPRLLAFLNALPLTTRKRLFAKPGRGTWRVVQDSESHEGRSSSFGLPYPGPGKRGDEVTSLAASQFGSL